MTRSTMTMPRNGPQQGIPQKQLTLVLDLSLDGINGIRRLDIQGDGLAGEGLYEDLL